MSLGTSQFRRLYCFVHKLVLLSLLTGNAFAALSDFKLSIEWEIETGNPMLIETGFETFSKSNQTYFHHKKDPLRNYLIQSSFINADGNADGIWRGKVLETDKWNRILYEYTFSTPFPLFAYRRDSNNIPVAGVSSAMNSSGELLLQVVAEKGDPSSPYLMFRMSEQPELIAESIAPAYLLSSSTDAFFAVTIKRNQELDKVLHISSTGIEAIPVTGSTIIGNRLPIGESLGNHRFFLASRNSGPEDIHILDVKKKIIESSHSNIGYRFFHDYGHGKIGIGQGRNEKSLDIGFSLFNPDGSAIITKFLELDGRNGLHGTLALDDHRLLVLAQNTPVNIDGSLGVIHPRLILIDLRNGQTLDTFSVNPYFPLSQFVNINGNGENLLISYTDQTIPVILSKFLKLSFDPSTSSPTSVFVTQNPSGMGKQVVFEAIEKFEYLIPMQAKQGYFIITN